MARQALADGIQTIVATPHVAALGPDWRAEIARRLQETRDALTSAELPLTLLPGAEVRFEPDLLRSIDRDSGLTLNGGPYVLVELMPMDYTALAERALFELQSRGLRPMLAHPERYGSPLSRLDTVRRLAKRGILVQLTARSITGEYGRESAAVSQTMLIEGIAQIIASDAHPWRPSDDDLRRAVRSASRLIGAERAEAMVTTAPQAVLDGNAVALPAARPPSAPPRTGGLRRLWPNTSP